MEDELTTAISHYRASLLNIAGTCVFLADLPATDQDTTFDPGQELVLYRDLKYTLGQTEALLAAIYTRSSVSWDHLAARQQCSRQALHQRLARKAEEVYQETRWDSHYEPLRYEADSARESRLLFRLQALMSDGEDASRKLARRLLALRRRRGRGWWWVREE